ncbi:MAG: phosphoribosylformylglycinamidine synthase subunit PurS [Tepidanaerobacteraceae bacterium]|nr:phosphoribosylformylglycinamidine synthase subunit PurS [Tepidanaerobacteraceae bacterium]
MINARIHVRFKSGVLDPQGTAVKGALKQLGFENVVDVRVGKLIEVKLNVEDEKDAKDEIKSMCEKLLANPVIEDYSFELSV